MSSPSRAGTAHAQSAALPDIVRALDVAAMDLFDAAEAGEWDDAARALQRIHSIAPGVSGLESTYVEAGGSVEHFIQVINNLSGDAAEASTALSTRDQRWLVSSADRIVSRAGELSQPFDGRGNAVIPHIDTLLFLARRMRRALVWRDDSGFVDAHDSFSRLWATLRNELAGKQAAAANAVQRALANIDKAPTRAAVKQLYDTTRALGVTAA